MDEKELRRILELVNEAYKQAGKQVKTAVLITEDEEKLLIDNREPEEIN